MRFTSSAEVYGCFASYHSLMVDDIIDPILSSNVVFENAALRVLGLLFFMCGGCVIGGEAKATAKLGLRISSNESYGIHDGLKLYCKSKITARMCRSGLNVFYKPPYFHSGKSR